MYLAYNTVAVEDLGKPVVMMCHRTFLHDAMSAASVKGLPGLHIVTTLMPGHEDNVDIIRKALSKEVMDNVVAALTKPLTAEEKSPKPREKVVEPWTPIFKGNLPEVNTFFYKRGWTGGSPIIPPTEEAVREMLTGTDLPADHVVAKVPVRYGKATVQKIAINAVMAGALPTYMPVLIAGVQCLVDEPYTRHVDHALVSLVSVSPGWIINGPIRNDLNVNSGYSLLCPETIANAAIARAMGLIIKNIGGIRPGVECMSTAVGHVGRYRVAFAENEEESPWEPLHVEMGLKKGDSAVTLFFVGGYNRLMAEMSFGATDKDFLSGVANGIVGAGVMFGGGVLILSPEAAQFLADKGWTKKKVVSFIAEQAKAAPRRRMSEKMEYPPGHFDVLIGERGGLKVVVAGPTGAGGLASHLSGGMAGWMTKKIELPANWDKLVKKYKDVVPTYARY